eukprot:1194383-Pyramimonas_sp.AAC.1
MGVGDACGRWHWPCGVTKRVRVVPKWVCVCGTCWRWHWGLRLSSLWGHDKCEGVPKWVCVTHAGGGTGAF